MVTKTSGTDRRAQTAEFLTRVPGAGFPTGSALRDAPRGWLVQEGLFGSSPAHVPSFPFPPGAAGATVARVQVPGSFARAGLCHRVFFPCMSDPEKHRGPADGASH